MGDYVTVDEVIADIEVHKYNVEVLAEHTGVITRYFIDEFDMVNVGERFVEIDTGEYAPDGYKP